MVDCPICGKAVREANINAHIDSGCEAFTDEPKPEGQSAILAKSNQAADFFRPSARKPTSFTGVSATTSSQPSTAVNEEHQDDDSTSLFLPDSPPASNKRPAPPQAAEATPVLNQISRTEHDEPPAKKAKTAPSAFQRAAPLAERMRPTKLDNVCGQDLVGPSGVLRQLIDTDRVPSMILWGGAGTGKTTIARVIAQTISSRFIEINSTNTGVAECKKLFAEAKNELGLTGRKTIIFCDEIHRFSKSQQDVFLAPVEAGTVTLIGATTENPSFKVQSALLSRCRVFTLNSLSEVDIRDILRRALEKEGDCYGYDEAMMDEEMVGYLAAFAEGDARIALNLLELAMGLSARTGTSKDDIKAALTKTMVYDRAGDQHYDTISAFQKSIRGSSADAALYYLARMLQSGEDPLYIARRMVIIASEDVGLASTSLLPLAVATHTAVSVIGLPEARINLAHCTCALALAPKSTRAYRGLNNAFRALKEPGIAGLPIPIHLRNAPTRLMKELGYGKEYKYNPSYRDGKVKQDYLPDKLAGRKFLEEVDLGDEVDPDLEDEEDGV